MVWAALTKTCPTLIPTNTSLLKCPFISHPLPPLTQSHLMAPSKKPGVHGMPSPMSPCSKFPQMSSDLTPMTHVSIALPPPPPPPTMTKTHLMAPSKEPGLNGMPSPMSPSSKSPSTSRSRATSVETCKRNWHLTLPLAQLHYLYHQN